MTAAITRRTGRGRAANLIDLTGERYGNLEVKKRAVSMSKGYQHMACWECLCDCGRTVDVASKRLRANHARFCGDEDCSFSKTVAAGKVFGMLTVLFEAPRLGNSKYWWCICECGEKHKARSTRLREGKVKSCGCGRDNSRNAQGISGVHSPESIAAEPEPPPVVRAPSRPKKITREEFEKSVKSFFTSGFTRAESEDLASRGVIVEGRAG